MVKVSVSRSDAKARGIETRSPHFLVLILIKEDYILLYSLHTRFAILKVTTQNSGAHEDIAHSRWIKSAIR